MLTCPLLQSILNANYSNIEIGSTATSEAEVAPISSCAKEARKTKSQSDIDGRLACHYFGPRQPSLPGNVDQYGKRQLYDGYAGSKICLLVKSAVADALLTLRCLILQPNPTHLGKTNINQKSWTPGDAPTYFVFLHQVHQSEKSF